MKCPNFEKCGTELTEMKNGKGEVTCTRCLKCNPMTKYVAPVKKQRRDVDVPWTDERVIEVIDRVVPDMIRETLENWHIQKPSVTQDDIKFLNNDRVSVEVKPDTIDNHPEMSRVFVVPTQTWRQQAKGLGISLSQPTGGARKKVDVLKDIEDKLVPVGV